MEKKSCRCRCPLFSCFACFSDENTNPSTAVPNAANEALTHPYHDSQPPVAPPAASSSEATTSTDVRSDLSSSSQLIVPSDLSVSSQLIVPSAAPSSSSQLIVPSAAPSSSSKLIVPSASLSSSSSQPIVPSAAPLSSSPSQPNTSPSSSNAATNNQLQETASSSSGSKADLDGHIQNIRTCANALHTLNVDADLDGLIEFVSQFLEVIKEEKSTGNESSKTKLPAKNFWQSPSESLKKFKEVLSEGINVFKDIIPGEAKTAVQGLLKGMGTAHLATTGLLIVALVLERLETVSANRKECLCVLDEIWRLAQHVKKLQQRPQLKEGMEDSMKEAMGLIVEAAIMCSAQIGSPKGWRFLTASGNKDLLVNFQQKLQRMYRHMDSKMAICIYDAANCRKVRPKKPQERPYPDYAVGIEEALKQVTELLEWESENNAVAVILYGFGGMGKSTLADAVFARLYIEGCKYSMVKLFDDINSTPSTSHILKLQRYILEDLKMETVDKAAIRWVEDGKREIGSILQREKAFIYVDNVLLPYPLEQLLPRDMVNAKKLRLLITTRDINACNECTKMITKFYDVKGIPHDDAKSLLKTGMKSQTDDMEEQLNSSQLDRIAEICGGIPKLLEVVAGLIRVEEDKQKAYNKVIQAKEENWKGKIGEGITDYVFAYKDLPEKLKDPFLDICAFFNGWDWDKVANIVGDDELEMLEQRALVKKDPRGCVTVHDVILAMGLQQTEGTRFTITNESQIQNLEDEDIDIKKIKGIRLLSGNKAPLCIPASRIDFMCTSLRVLELGDNIQVEGMCEKTFKKLICFVDKGFHLRFNVSKSKELKYFYGAAEDFNLLQMPSSLVHVELNGKSFNSHPFQISSQCLGQLRNLRVLTLTRFSQLTQLPQKLVDVAEGLQYLRLQNCEHLEELPEFNSKLRCLKELEISSCKSFRKLPEDVGSLNSLQKLTLYCCESLEVLPSSLDKLSSLQELDVSSCKRLEVLPNGLDKLLSLKVLDLAYCENLKNLTFDLGKLTSLVQLRLQGCEKLSSIPQSISQLKLLESTMDLSWTGLKELPDGFCNLSFVTNLQLGWCRSLKKLPDRFGEVASLVKLSLNYCESLKELPESFGRLKTLEQLDLSECVSLEELCRDFKGLLSLRVLSLDFCGMLKTLPEDFHCLTSLEILGLRYCRMLEGKWMERVVKMKTLQMIVNIEGSPMLEERWGEIQRQGDQSVHPIRDNFAVHTGQGLPNDESKENVLKRLQPEFDSILTNGRGEAFHTSDIPLNTLLLVMFDDQEEFHDYGDYYPLDLIEGNIDDIESNVNMIYFGNYFNKLPKKVADIILGRAPANSNVQPLFQKVFATLGRKKDVVFQSQFWMSMKIASDQKGDKYFSSWKQLRWRLMEEFVMEKCGRYQRLKKLAEGSAESNTELLRELFATGEGEDIHCCFVKNDGSDKVGVDELKGKTILLDIRPVNLGYELPLQALTEMYVAEKERLNFEIITIPVKGRYEKWDALDKFSSDIPWLVLQSPWQLTNVTKYFLVEGCARWDEEWGDEWDDEWDEESDEESDDEWYLNTRMARWPQAWDKWYPNIMRVIDSNGRIAAHNSVGVLRMVNTWGAEAYPFTEEKSKELEEKEMNQMKTMSDLMFIFKHLEEVEATHQPKMICLCTSDDIEFISSIRNALIEWSDSFVIIYIPKFGKKDRQGISFRDGICGYFEILKRLEMVQIKMEGMTVLNLSEYKAMRFWTRIFSLKEVMERIEDNQKQFSRMKNLLSSIHSWRLRDSGYSWMVIMDEDGNLLTTKGTEIVKVLSKENLDDKAKQLMQQLFKGAKESRKETLVELEQLFKGAKESRKETLVELEQLLS